MKKKLGFAGKALLFVFFISTGCIQAQTLIPRVGLSMARTTRRDKDVMSTDYGTQLKPGILVGLAFEYPLKGKFSLQGELTYIQKGQILTDVNSQVVLKDRYDYRVNYLELPIMIKATLGNGRIKFQPHIGASVSYGLSGTMKWTYTDQYGSLTKTYDIRFEKLPPYPNPVPNDVWYLGSALDYGIQAGFGVYFFKKILFDVRYSIGLKGLRYQYGGAMDRNEVFQFSLGMPIRLKMKGA